MAFNVRMRKGVNIKRVVTKIAVTVLTLYVGGTILTQIGTTMNGTCSPFYQGLTLIGWTIGTGTNTACSGLPNTINATQGSGILSVIGIIGIASIVMEFVSFNF